MVPVPLRLELLENIFSLLFVSYSDICSDDPLEEENTEEEVSKEKDCVARRQGHCASQGSSTSTSPQHCARPKRKPDVRIAHASRENSGVPVLLDVERDAKNCSSFSSSYLDLKHFTSSFRGFLADDVAMEGLLHMLLDELKEIEGCFPWDSRHVPLEELALMDSLNLSVNKDGFGRRAQLLSKYLSEAQWRHKIVMSNRNASTSFPECSWQQRFIQFLPVI